MKESTPGSEQGSIGPPTAGERRQAWIALAFLVAILGVPSLGALFLFHDALPLEGGRLYSEGLLSVLVALFLAATPAVRLIWLAVTLLHELGHAVFVLTFGMALTQRSGRAAADCCFSFGCSTAVGPGWRAFRSNEPWSSSSTDPSCSGWLVFTPWHTSRSWSLT